MCAVFYDRKSAALAFGSFFRVDRAAKGTGLLLDLAALYEKEARACGLIKEIAFLVNVHMLRKKTAPRGYVSVFEANKYRAAYQVARRGGFSVCVGVRKVRNARRALQQSALRLTRKIFVLLDVDTLNGG